MGVRLLVVGGGIVGLSVAWHLERLGAKVIVLERSRVGDGASFGNAGWISPLLATPLPEPALLRSGVRLLTDRTSPVFIPPRIDGRLGKFAWSFARHCTAEKWESAMGALAALSREAVESFVEMEEGGVGSFTVQAPILAAFREREASLSFCEELDNIGRVFDQAKTEVLEGQALHTRYPVLSRAVTFGMLLEGQHFVDAHRFCKAVSATLDEVREGSRVVGLAGSSEGVTVALANGEKVVGDGLVWAAGAWTQYFARHLGIKVPLIAGRGYSFQVATPSPVVGPIYFPVERLACTPRGDGLRVGGTMELADPEDALEPRRIDAMVAAGKGVLSGVDLGVRRESWVGPRPVTADGLPLIGKTRLDHVWIATGHGMWGVTHGPVTGRLIARQVMEGVTDSRLDVLDPLRER